MPRVQPIYNNTFARRRRTIYILIALVVLVIAGAGGYWLMHRNPRPSNSSYPVLGVRLDQTDGFPDFDQLHQLDVRYVYLKATEGASYFDDNFSANYERASSSTMAVGAYHYFSFASTPAAQANYFFSKVGASIGTLPIGIQVSEYTSLPAKATLGRNLTEFVNLMKVHYGQDCIIMASPKVLAYISEAAPGTQRMQIGGSRREASRCQFWEYSSSAPVPGGSDKYRCSVFMGKRKAFQKLLTQ
ncbi:GH25 family lysozyme [Lacticaseibacillus zhaodongensis]|uniref:GH25 family lysozyme n=1 Tax=Lacticaseibacillus zhaodongensis TaxID=2668065 RepID=UPI0012D2FCE6|nr:GH25 family lysozyme [Lacticaseibacillus zhaodongensis]